MTPRTFKGTVFITLLGILLVACEPLAYNPTPFPVVITSLPTRTPVPTATGTIPPTATNVPPTPTATPQGCDETASTFIDVDDNPTAQSTENLRFRVLVPPCYQSSGKRFPVVYLMHGLSYDEDQWEELGIQRALEQGLRLGILPPMIIVMPYMGNLGQRNSFPPQPSYETFIMDELRPFVENNFCTYEARDYRAIGGISRGGWWAYSIAMRHVDQFAAVGGHSAFFPVGSNDIPPAYDPLEIAVNSVLVASGRLRMYLDNGAADSSGPSQEIFSARLTQRSIPHTYDVFPTGEHNNEYWSAHIDEYLAFYGRDWPNDFGQLPECSAPSPTA